MKKINTLKLLCLCALGCICTTNAMAQSTGSGLYRIADERAADLEVGKDYVIYNTAMNNNGSEDRTGFIYANSGTGLGLTKKKPVNKEVLTAEYVWTIETGTDGKYYLKSKSKGTYVSHNGTTNNTDGVDIIIEKWMETSGTKSPVYSENAAGNTIANSAITADDRLWIIGQGDGNSNSSWWNGLTGGWTRWSNAHPYAFYAAEELGEDDMVQVTYTYSLNGQELGEKQVTEYNGCAPTEPGNVPPCVTATGFPTIIEAGTTVYPIETTYNDQLPFTISTDETSVYYRVKFNQANGYYWYANASNQGKEEYQTCNGLTLATEQNWKWKFVGDWFNGFNIMTQSGKYLTANSTTQNNGGTTLTDASDASKSYFLLQKFDNNQYWRFNLKGSDMNLAHTSSRDLNISLYYDAARPNYEGAKLIFEEMGDFRTMLDELYATKDEAKGYLEMTHVGTPVADATERTELQATVTQIDNLDYNTISYQTYKDLPEPLNTQLTAYRACTNLLMPEDGKAYKLTNSNPLFADYGEKELVIKNDVVSFIEAGTNTEENANVWVARKLDNGKFVLVNGKTGGYMELRGKNYTHNGSSKGYTSAYQTDGYSDVDIKLVAGNYLGYVQLSFLRSGSANRASIICDKNGASNGYFDIAGQNYTSNNRYNQGFKMEEVDYPSSVQLRAVDNIEGITAIGTFSAPYAAIVPEGVTAHYISSADNKAQATAIAEGEAIPAGQGVLLTGEAGTAVMQPATTEAQATIEGNLLGNTAGAAKALEHGKDYILTSGTLPNGNQGVAFYPISATDLTVSANKAYLHTEGSNAPALVLSFGEGETDGVKGIDGAEDGQAPVFDLQGRRVQKAVKGLYIQNGKKFMVK